MDLHLNDFEDMLLLVVQHKLFHLNESDIFDFIMSLRMFTRSLVIKKCVEDLQLGVENYKKKLNITAPQKTFPEIEFKELYTPSYKPPKVIYEDLNKQKRVMRADELYKFSDGTLKKVQDDLHHRLLSIPEPTSNKLCGREINTTSLKSYQGDSSLKIHLAGHSIKLEYNFQECLNALTDKLNWNNPEGDHYLFNMSKPLPLQGRPCHLTVVADYFFNNDLEFLKTFNPEKMYTTSITKTKAARYEIKGIKDMLYKFKEGDFMDLHLNGFEDMLLLVVQHKLFHLNESDIFDFIMALRMFTRSLVIKKCVEDLQLGVENYKKKLNITTPQKTFLEIEFKELYTPSYKPPEAIYEDLNKQKRVMRADELYKFSDGTLKKVQDDLHHRLLSIPEPTSNKLCG
nr:hypothetical protein [Tanacetum cinerariifolium]